MDLSLLCWADSEVETVYSVGDVIDVSPAHNDPCDHPRFVIVNITDIPVTNESRVKKSLESRVRVFGSPTQRNVLRNRRWRIQTNLMLPRDRNALNRDRVLTVDWTTAMTFVVRKVVIDETDPSLDQEVPIQRGDIE